jgi:hypothetical protein
MIIPPNARPGQQIQVRTPEHAQIIQVMVPGNSFPGTEVIITFPYVR